MSRIITYGPNSLSFFMIKSKCAKVQANIEVTKHIVDDEDPERFRTVKEDGKRSENYIHKFLEDVQLQYGFKTWVKHEVGCKEDVEVVKRAYNDYMKSCHPVVRYKFSTENAAWTDCGFEICRVHVCKNYSDKNRTKKTYVKNLKLITEEIN